MWNYSNVKPIQECYDLTLQNLSKYMSKVSCKETNEYLSHAIYSDDKPAILLLLDKQKEHIKISHLNWITSKSGKKYSKLAGKYIYRYGMCFSPYQLRYHTLPSDLYIDPNNQRWWAAPSLARLSKDEAFICLSKQFGKTFVSRYNNHLFEFPYSLFKQMDKASFERARQFISKVGINISHVDILLNSTHAVDFGTVFDYIRICRQLNKKIKVGLSIRRYRELHDEYVKELNAMQLSKIKNRKLNINKGLQFDLDDKGISLIKDLKTLYQEGQEQSHCVGSYAPAINKGECAIYTTTIDNMKYTIELVPDENGVKINQMMSKYNAPASHKLVSQIEQLFNENKMGTN